MTQKRHGIHLDTAVYVPRTLYFGILLYHYYCWQNNSAINLDMYAKCERKCRIQRPFVRALCGVSSYTGTKETYMDKTHIVSSLFLPAVTFDWPSFSLGKIRKKKTKHPSTVIRWGFFGRSHARFSVFDFSVVHSGAT